MTPREPPRIIPSQLRDEWIERVAIATIDGRATDAEAEAMATRQVLRGNRP